jgi:hypothetical protein
MYLVRVQTYAIDYDIVQCQHVYYASRIILNNSADCRSFVSENLSMMNIYSYVISFIIR